MGHADYKIVQETNLGILCEAAPSMQLFSLPDVADKQLHFPQGLGSCILHVHDKLDQSMKSNSASQIANIIRSFTVRHPERVNGLDGLKCCSIGVMPWS